MNYHVPRNVEADAQFIESGGLKDWGCFALLISILGLVLFFFIARALLTLLIGATAALWVTLVLLIGIVAGITFLWIRRREKKKVAFQELQRY